MGTGKKNNQLEPEKLKKGILLVVKAAPFFDREYIYEISGAGEKVVRANLFRSPRVKKQWSYDEIELLFENGLIRFAADSDLEKLAESRKGADQSEQ